MDTPPAPTDRAPHALPDGYTPTRRGIPLRHGDFACLTEALEHAAGATTGMNFHDGRGRLAEAVPYAALRQRALACAARLQALGLQPGDRVALLADTSAAFASAFFGCRYAGLVPVPLPTQVNLGGRESFTGHLGRMVTASSARVCAGPADLAEFIETGTACANLAFAGTWEALDALPLAADFSPAAVAAQDPAYIQFTSGSTRFPRGAVVSEAAVMANLQGILRHGLAINEQDRFLSWLPLYHDMGLVGKLLTPVAGQLSVDYLDARAFAMRPRLWPELLSRTRATVSFSPGFGYELCARRLRPGEAARYDLSHWRVAGAGAEMIKAQVLERFATALAPAGFRAEAFLPSYGMAEVALAVCFSSLGERPFVDPVHREATTERGQATPCTDPQQRRDFVGCGTPLPGYRVEVRGPDGLQLPERRVGRVCVQGPSTMLGYLDDPEASAEVLLEGGWLDTGDLGYVAEGQLVITGRAKDLIIVNGRNIWPQDLEYLAEDLPGVRPGDAAAFSVAAASGEDVVLLLQCRSHDAAARAELEASAAGRIRAELGIDCRVDLVPPHSLPRTSSGKLARGKARQDWLANRDDSTPCASP